MNDSIEQMVQAINQQLPQLKGNLHLWGQIFSRPYGSLYAVVECIGTDEQLILTFDEGEKLTVWHPQDLRTADGVLTILQADQIRWEWVQSDWPKVPGTTHLLDLCRKEDDIEVFVDTGEVAARFSADAVVYPALELK